MKQWWILGWVVLLVINQPVLAEEDITTEILESYTEFYGDVFEEQLEDAEADDAFASLFAKEEPKEILSKLVQGKIDLSPSAIGKTIIQFFIGEVYQGIKLLIFIVILSVLCSYLTGLQEGFGAEGVGMVAFYACYIIIAGIASVAFYQTAECAGDTVEQIALFMKMVVPLVITTLVTCGALVSATVLEPVLITVVELSVAVIQGIMIPAVMIATGMNIVNHLSDRFKTQKLVKFMNQSIKWGMSVMLTVFVSVAGIQSIASGGADALSVKLSKFATANLIPVVGGILAESVETVMNCSVLIKNSVGIFGILCLVAMVVFPILKIAAMLLLFRLTAAVCEPISEPKIIGCISEFANSISVLFSILTAVCVMFVMVLTIVINAGNTALMLGR
ncbi:MAG: stage III sporulation protein AE [Clostridia bacterium]|nr:stage III sporulation protein AE [Clostridia bacterium]